MTKSKAQRKREDAIRALKEKIHFCQRRADFVGVIKYTKELEAMNQMELVKMRTTLRKCMGDCSKEDKNEAVARLICVIAIGDILSGAIGDLKAYMRDKFNIMDISLITLLEEAYEKLQKAVESIDKVGNEFFSYNYMDIVQEIEMQYGATLYNSAMNKVIKASKKPQGIQGLHPEDAQNAKAKS